MFTASCTGLTGLRSAPEQRFKRDVFTIVPNAATPTQRPRLIVTADDFGLHQAVNEAVERGFRDGVLRAASLMVAAPAMADAVARARRNPGLAVGLHLVLAVAVRTSTASQGAVELNSGVNVLDIFEKHVLPEVPRDPCPEHSRTLVPGAWYLVPVGMCSYYCPYP